MKKSIIACCCVLMVALLFYGCGFQDQRNTKQIVLAAGRDLAQGKEETYFCSSVLKVWEPLIGLSCDGEIIPKLAESWESRNEGKEWIFHLRKNVFFHDGEPFNSMAVLQNFNRYQNMGLRATSYYYFTMDRIYPNFERIEADDEYTVHLYFSQAEPLLPYRMVEWGSAMYSPQSFDLETGDFKEKIAGTGPFRLVEHEPDSYIILRRNDSYYGEKAKAETLKIVTMPSMETRYSALRSEEIMGVLDLGGISPLMAKELLGTGLFNVSVQKSTISHYLSINGDKYPFNDERMVQSISMAIDREKIVHYYFNDYAKPTINFLNSVTPFSVDYSVTYDKNKAIELAHQVLGDRKVNVKFLLTRSGVERYPYKVIAEFLQAELRPLGLNIDIQMVDDLAASIMKQKGDYDMAISIRGLDNLDPSWLVNDFFYSKGGTNTRNHFGYNNSDVDEILLELRNAKTIEGKRFLFQRLQEELIHHPAVVPLMEGKNVIVSNKRIQSYNASIYGASVETVQWAESEKKQ